MARILVTGSTQGIGRATAEALMDGGHQVVTHARSHERAASLAVLTERGADVVVGDLANRQETLHVADQVSMLGRMDAVIHNAGVYADDRPFLTTEGHPRVLAVNVLAPYLLTALIDRPDRLIYLTSDMHMSGNPNLTDLNWTTRRWNGVQAYRDSKLLLTTMAFAIARHWPRVRSNAVDPGWVPTQMGGPQAPDDLELGHRTQAWLATSEESGASTSGAYWHHHRRLTPAAAVTETHFQDTLLDTLAEITDMPLLQQNPDVGGPHRPWPFGSRLHAGGDG